MTAPLRSTLLRISGRKLDGKTDLEFQIGNECYRFLSICIIYYNADILSEVFKICQKQNFEEMCEMIKRFSPVAWAHINCVGKFEFLKNHQTIDLQATATYIIQNHVLGIFSKTQ